MLRLQIGRKTNPILARIQAQHMVQKADICRPIAPITSMHMNTHLHHFIEMFTNILTRPRTGIPTSQVSTPIATCQKLRR